MQEGETGDKQKQAIGGHERTKYTQKIKEKHNQRGK
jgi:hypothetical protein